MAASPRLDPAPAMYSPGTLSIRRTATLHVPHAEPTHSYTHKCLFTVHSPPRSSAAVCCRPWRSEGTTCRGRPAEDQRRHAQLSQYQHKLVIMTSSHTRLMACRTALTKLSESITRSPAASWLPSGRRCLHTSKKHKVTTPRSTEPLPEHLQSLGQSAALPCRDAPCAARHSGEGPSQVLLARPCPVSSLHPVLPGREHAGGHDAVEAGVTEPVGVQGVEQLCCIRQCWSLTGPDMGLGAYTGPQSYMMQVG